MESHTHFETTGEESSHEEMPMKEKPKFGLGSIINHKYFGRGRVSGYDEGNYVVYFKGEMKKVPFTYAEMELEGEAGNPEMDLVKNAVREVLGDFGWIESDIEMGSRWTGGSVQLIPGKSGTQAKEIPLEVFFKKIIGVREKLRVLEQKINNHPKLDEADKLELHPYITRAYGSLTTFNVLFSDKRLQFRGSSTKAS